MSKQFILTVGPFSDEVIELVSRSWGWLPGTETAEEYLQRAGALKFGEVLSAPKIQTLQAQEEFDSIRRRKEIADQVAAETASLVDFKVEEIENE